MKLVKTSSVEELQVVSRFESLRKILLSDQYAVHLEKPLAYWALPTDRRLPLAFLGRTLKDLLGSSFDDLAATPGIGQKKMRSFVKLLGRVSNTDAAELEVDLHSPTDPELGVRDEPRDCDGFDPATVSEVVWAQWRASVIRHGLGKEPLGRFAPSLQNMTRVIWNTPLDAYTRTTLAEIRSMKTHGEKRVRAILEVFYSLHALVSAMGAQDHLVLRIVPRRIDGVENWVGHWLQTPDIPSEQEIFENFVNPLLNQVRTDATRQISQLAENRLGVHGPITSVRQVARTMGLTRARVYQLLNEINDIMNVRWPLGRHQTYELAAKFQAESDRLECQPKLNQFRAAIELFYPNTRRGAAGPLERISEATGRQGDVEGDDLGAEKNGDGPAKRHGGGADILPLRPNGNGAKSNGSHLLYPDAHP